MSGSIEAAPVWENATDQARRSVKWVLWFVTWVALLVGLFDRRGYDFVVLFSVAHAVLFLALFRFQLVAFPVQVRVAYVLWVVIGTYVPYGIVLMYITTVGLIGNLFLSYCPLARMLYLLPWNRDEAFSLGLVGRVFLSPPVKGRFRPSPNVT